MSVAGEGTPATTTTSLTTIGPLLQRQPVIGRSKPLVRSTWPFSPKSEERLPVLALIATRFAPTLVTMRASLPSVQYAMPRVAPPRAGPCPSGRGGRLSYQSVLPVVGSSATTAPTAELIYITPPTTSGVC